MSAQIITLKVVADPERPRFYSTDHVAKVHAFAPRTATCGVCGSSNHRASSCSHRPGPARDRLKVE
jgi:hypothetical protein